MSELLIFISRTLIESVAHQPGRVRRRIHQRDDGRDRTGLGPPTNHPPGHLSISKGSRDCMVVRDRGFDRVVCALVRGLLEGGAVRKPGPGTIQKYFAPTAAAALIPSGSLQAAVDVVDVDGCVRARREGVMTPDGAVQPTASSESQ